MLEGFVLDIYLFLLLDFIVCSSLRQTHHAAADGHMLAATFKFTDIIWDCSKHFASLIHFALCRQTPLQHWYLCSVNIHCYDLKKNILKRYVYSLNFNIPEKQDEKVTLLIECAVWNPLNIWSPIIKGKSFLKLHQGVLGGYLYCGLMFLSLL